jgi:ketosteroid isomerase-like protein
MRGAWLVVIVLVLGCLQLLGQATGVTANKDVIAEADIKALEQRLCTLVVNRRYHEYELYLADDYARTLPSGKVENKAEMIDAFAVQRDVTVAMTPEDMSVRVYGDAAVLTLRMTTEVRSGEGVEARFSRVTELFVRREGRWYLAATAAIPLSE